MKMYFFLTLFGYIYINAFAQNNKKLFIKMQEIDQLINHKIDSTLVLVFGKKGSGKSTLINFLVGNRLEAYEEEKELKLRLVKDDKNICNLKKDEFKSSDDFTPNQCNDELNNLIYLEYLNYKESNIFDREFLNFFISSKYKIKIMIVITEEDFLDLGIYIIIKQISNIFKKSIVKLKGKVNLIVTKSMTLPLIEYENNFRTILEIFLNYPKNDIEIEEKLILDFLIEKKDSILLFLSPKEIDEFQNEHYKKLILNSIKSTINSKLEET